MIPQNSQLQNNLSFEQERFNKEHNHDGINSAKLSSAYSGGNFAVGSGTRAATTGTLSLTGLGFTPKLIIFKAWKGGASASYTDESLASHSYGHAKSSSDDHCHTFFFRAGGIMAWINTQSDNLVRLIGIDGDDDVICDFVSMDEDGFTINWIIANDSCNYMYEAFG